MWSLGRASSFTVAAFYDCRQCLRFVALSAVVDRRCRQNMVFSIVSKVAQMKNLAIYDNICQVIGKTPVVRLNRIPRWLGGDVGEAGVVQSRAVA